jgi:two-component sensor histidine kinase
LDHRVANSLQLAVDFLLFQQTQLADPTARKALIDAAERLVAVGHLHRFLCAHTGDGEVDLKPFLEELAALIGQSTGLHCLADVESVRISGEMAQQIGLAVNELAINAAKHAYSPGEPGDLLVHAMLEGERLCLSVADRGPGLGKTFDIEAATGLGLNILRAITRQLGARLKADDDELGARFTLIVPLPTMPRQSRSFAPRNLEQI